MSSELASAVKKAVHDNLPSQLLFTRELIQHGGQRGDEAAVQDKMFQQYQQRGYAPVRLSMEAEQLSQHPTAGKTSAEHSKVPVIIGVHTPKSGASAQRSLVLNGHIDIVPVGDKELWTDDPYSGKVRDDWLYGRGSGDMRAGLVASMFALDALRKVGKQPASKVIIESVPEEESTGNGTMMAHLAGYTADAAIIPEPSAEKLVRANAGVIWFQVKVRGVPVHAYKATDGSNAISSTLKIIEGLKLLEETMNERKRGHMYFEDMEHPINLNIAKIQGGDWASSVPACCTIDGRVALFPGVSPDDVAEEVADAVEAIAKEDSFLKNSPPQVEWNGFFADGYVLEPGSDAENLLHSCHGEVAGTTLEDIVVPGYMDSRIFGLYDKIPALVYGPRSEAFHGFDERVSISSIERVTATIALFIAEWCGLESI